MLRANGTDADTNKIIDEATKNLMEAYDNNEINLIEDWEVNELLSWTNGLNFEEQAKFQLKIIHGQITFTGLIGSILFVAFYS